MQFREIIYGRELPFSFRYGDKSSDDVLKGWRRDQQIEKLSGGRTKITRTWSDSGTGLNVICEMTEYSDFPAVDWVLWFEHVGAITSHVIEDVQALDITLDTPLIGDPFRLHRTVGAPSDPTDFTASVVPMRDGVSQVMGGGGGRSSNKDFTFFKVEAGDGSYIFAVGWSGQWGASLECPDDEHLRIRAGLEKTHFVLHCGEKVRGPRILMFRWAGDTLESNAQFRQLIYKHYCAKRDGRDPLPILFCNTAFTRGGGWLNECNAENQISLIEAYAPLGLEALITDAGWFEGGWPSGAGNWNVRKDAYPEGMGPVAQAAKDRGMLYGLWFEPERVVAGTEVHCAHPDWCLASRSEPEETYLLNFGLPEVRDYFFNIVKGFMQLPGFRFYRQDFNMDPLPYWRFNDAPDRQGITEMKYVMGLYAYGDRIRVEWPDAILEECASGGRRIDLETVMRLHTQQESDYWFDNETDQNQIWGLSQYLPNNVFNTPLIRLDDYSFHSTMATSLIPGWIADEEGFDTARAKKLLDRYREVRHLLIGAWYPLLPQSSSAQDCMASQWHRPDLGEGMIIALRRPESPKESITVTLHALDPDALYELTFDSAGEKKQVSGKDLMRSLTIPLPGKPSSELVVYRESGTRS